MEIKMTGRGGRLMGRKAESICTAWKKNLLEHEKKNRVAAIRQSISSFEEDMKRNAVSKACYVYINGVSMPVINA